MPKEIKSTKSEVNERVNTISEMIIDGVPHNEIIQNISTKYNISDRQVYNYIKKAQELIQETTKHNIHVEICKAQRRYEKIYNKAIKDKNYKIALGAQRSLCELFGLNQPRKFEIPGMVDFLGAIKKANESK